MVFDYRLAFEYWFAQLGAYFIPHWGDIPFHKKDCETGASHFNNKVADAQPYRPPRTRGGGGGGGVAE
jgi:hypothetical protein